MALVLGVQRVKEATGVADPADTELTQADLAGRSAETGNDIDRTGNAVHQRGNRPFVADTNREDAVRSGFEIKSAAADGFVDRRRCAGLQAQEDVSTRIQYHLHPGCPGGALEGSQALGL